MMADVWLVITECGAYSDYEWETHAVAATLDRAKQVGETISRRLYDKYHSRIMRNRSEWPDHSRRMLDEPWSVPSVRTFYLQTAEEQFPLAAYEPPTWERDERDGDLRYEAESYDDWRISLIPVRFEGAEAGDAA